MKLIEKLFSFDVRSLALFRVCLALVILLNLLLHLPHVKDFFTDDGYIPRVLIHGSSSATSWLSLHMISGEIWFQYLLFGVMAICVLLLLVGYKTTFMTLLSWILYVSMNRRSEAILHGADTVLAVLLFWSLFLPLGERFSVDRVMRKSLSSNVFFSPAVFAYILQVSYIYFFSALHKYGTTWTTDANAIYHAFNYERFARPLGRAFLSWPMLLQMMTRAIWWTELLVGLLFFIPFNVGLFRLLGIIIIVMMNVQFGMFLRIDLFPVVNILAIIPLLPTELWNSLSDYWKKKQQSLRVYYDSRCGFCVRVVRFIQTFLLINEDVFIDAEANKNIKRLMDEKDSWIAEINGTHYYKFDTFIEISKVSPLLFFTTPILKTKLLKSFGNWLYHIWSAKRKSCELVAFQKVKLTYHYSISVGIITAAFIVFITIWNIGTLRNSPITLTRPMGIIAELMGLNQKWNMFAPPPDYNGWFIMKGTTTKGELVNVFPYSKPDEWGKTEDASLMNQGIRIRKYMETIRESHPYRERYLQMLCDDWNKSHSEDMLREVEFEFFIEKTTSNLQRLAPQLQRIQTHYCTY